jgi:hypothetical protein
MSMTYEEIAGALRRIPNIKTKDIDTYNRALIRKGADVSALKAHAIADPLVHRTYFQVSMGQLGTVEEQLDFIEENEDLLADWWHVDQLPQFLKKPLPFDLAFEKAKRYVCSEKPFTRRWGYVIFFTGLAKDENNVSPILSLMKNDDEYYVQMAEAWLLCELAVFHGDLVLEFMRASKLKYNILGKAIQKIQDSYRISEADKQAFRALRAQLKNNG